MIPGRRGKLSWAFSDHEGKRIPSMSEASSPAHARIDSVRSDTILPMPRFRLFVKFVNFF
jgi:hypothetical protein